MKKLNLSLVVLAAALTLFGLGGSALAFHDGGVANCDGCHTMHNSLDGAIMANGGIVGTGVSTWLTKGSDPSSTCLNCHAGTGGYHIFSNDGSNFSAGGDFYWLTKTFSWSAHGHTSYSSGDDHGHNVIAADYGLVQDATLSTAPGGTFNAGGLGCNSCHDPHAQKNGGTKGGFAAIIDRGSYGAYTSGDPYGRFRILGDVGYDGGEGGGQSFGAAAPIAQAANRSYTTIDYGSGMSEWCANCHTGFTADSSNPMRHPASNDAHLSGTYQTNYNSYVASGDFTGNSGTAYLAIVPFERGAGATLAPGSTVGATATSNVMCLTCHRAHAGAFQNIGRWDFTETFLADSHPAGTGDNSTLLDKQNSYYMAGASFDPTVQFGQYQRSLCNKCHVQD